MNLKEDYWDGFLANACVYGGLRLWWPAFMVACVYGGLRLWWPVLFCGLCSGFGPWRVGFERLIFISVFVWVCHSDVMGHYGVSAACS
jgi:hypothetical protein